MVSDSMDVGRFTYGHNKIRVRTWSSADRLKIGSFCSIADSVTVNLGGNHRIDWATTFPFGHIFKRRLGGETIVGHPSSNGDVIIGNDVWIGTGVTIMSGVNIEDGAVIAANSHVVSNVKRYAIVGGNPDKHLKFRFDQRIRELLLELSWWELDLAVIREIAPLLSTPPEATTLISLISRFRNSS